MAPNRATLLMLTGCILGGTANACLAQAEATLPAGVKVVWDLDKAWREKTATRERVCLNGLWRWQPARDGAEAPPADTWGYFKVPGCWPGISDYMQKDCQTVHAHPSWRDARLGGVTAAWHQRRSRFRPTGPGRPPGGSPCRRSM